MSAPASPHFSPPCPTRVASRVSSCVGEKCGLRMWMLDSDLRPMNRPMRCTWRLPSSPSPCQFFLALATVLAPASAKAADPTEPAASERSDDRQAEAHQEETAPPTPPAKIDEQRAAIASYYAGFHLGIDPG